MLYNIKLFSKINEKVYEENLPFNNIECNEQTIKDFISFIRPTLNYVRIQYEFVRELKPLEK